MLPNKMDESGRGENHPSRVDTDSEVEVLLNTQHVQYGGVSSCDAETRSGSEDHHRNRWQKVWGVVSTLTIEPVMFTFMIGGAMNFSVLPNMVMDKGCLFLYRYPEDVCRNLSAHDHEKEKVELLATDYNVYGNLLSVVAAFAMTFVAPWSDKYSRKLPLLLVLFGTLLTDVGYIFCTVHYDSDLFYVVLSRLSTELPGGSICVFALCFSLASEMSSPRNRSLKYTSVEVALGLGMALGGLAGGLLYRYYGYLWVYVAAAACHLSGCLWAALFVPETRGLNLRETTWREKAGDFFVLNSVQENVSAVFRKRPGNARRLLLLLMLCMCLIVLNYDTLGTIDYVYVHHLFNWDPTMYSFVTTASMLMGFGIMIIVVPIFVRVLKFEDFTLGIIGTLSMMMKNFLVALSARNISFYYAGIAVGVFIGLTTLSIRTSISKLVDKDEVGRVFSLLATCEAILPLVGTVVVTQIFERTMDTYPNVTYSMTVVWMIVPLLTFIWALKKTRTPVGLLHVPR